MGPSFHFAGHAVWYTEQGQSKTTFEIHLDIRLVTKQGLQMLRKALIFKRSNVFKCLTFKSLTFLGQGQSEQKSFFWIGCSIVLISFQTFALARYAYRSKTATNFTILQCCVTLSPMSAYFTMLFPIPLGQQIIEPLVCSTTKNPALKTITLLEFSSTFSNNIDKTRAIYQLQFFIIVFLHTIRYVVYLKVRILL